MSYDLQLWSTASADIPGALPDADRWRLEGDLWVWAGPGWQLIVGPRHRVEFEDVPESVHAALPGVQHMTELTLQPIDAPRSGHLLLRRAAKALASSAHGAIVDLQTDTVTTPAGTHRFVASRAGSTVDALALSWFSVDDDVRSRAWLDGFVGVLERWLPEALPVRYGPYEPPSYRLRETGRQHLVDFLADEYLKPRHRGLAVWFPKRPVLKVALSLDAGPSRSGWRSHRVTIAVEASVLQQPGWATALQQLWRRIAHMVGAFYSDARTLCNQRRSASTVDEWLSADRHPVCSSFWAGIPAHGGHAVALGQPYLRLWPEFQAAGEQDRDIVFLAEPDWTQPRNVFERVGGVPEALAEQSPGYAAGGLGPNLSRLYPSTWPFGETHTRP